MSGYRGIKGDGSLDSIDKVRAKDLKDGHR